MPGKNQQSGKKQRNTAPSRGVPIGLIAVILIGVIAMVVWMLRGGQAEYNTAPNLTSFVSGSQLPPDRWAEPETCRTCHETEYREWTTSNHADANRRVDAKKDGPAFTGSFVNSQGERFQFLRDGEKFALAVSGSGLGALRFPVEGVIGVKPLRQYLLSTGSGRYQATSVAWDVNRGAWFDVFPGEHREAYTWGHWLGQGMNWNSNCAGCHMTEFTKNFEPASASYRSTWRFQGISCVQCHANAATHARKASLGQKQAAKVALTASQRQDQCGSCHSRREELTADGLRPGNNYNDQYRLTLPGQPGVYYDDGQIHEEDFEFGSFLLSKMGGKAGVTCLDCHNPHTLAPRLPVENNQLCMSCHGTGIRNAPLISPSAHSHHVDGSTGNQCINCHMPTTTYMARHPRHDHGFLRPDPRLTKELGIPNACNKCHTDKTTDWALDAAEKWFGPGLNASVRNRSRIVHRAREGEAGAGRELAALIEKEEVPAWRATLVGLLSPYLNEEEAFSSAKKALLDPSPLVRAQAVRVLSEVPEAVPEIAKMESDPVRTVRLEAGFACRATLKPDSPLMREVLAYLQANADRPGHALMAADLAMVRHKPEDGVREAQRAVELDPKNAVTLCSAATVLARAAKLDLAQRMLEEAVKVSPDSADAHYSLGLLRAEKGDLAGAVESLRSSTRLAPENARAWYNLALALTKQEQWKEALSAIEAADAGAPGSYEIRYAEALILAHLGRNSESEAILRTLPNSGGN